MTTSTAERGTTASTAEMGTTVSSAERGTRSQAEPWETGFLARGGEGELTNSHSAA
ncbi:MAG: hypothetical protein GDA38_16900 [Hormoscilla sp. SP12CHS1]|nr:hypothetical protein [Hormoscilla sp. SP12CHS1]